ncbi:hypothetical protein [Sphingobium sp. MK2]|uniref:hypothetical protein n=1 Tax=Sphingobium sp. MK2 TaxID=3116540 RepID=UPI0032E358D5
MKPAMLIRHLLAPCLILAANSAISPALAQPRSVIAQPARLSYADLIDFADQAPMVAHVRIRNIIALKPDQAQGVPPGHKRLFIEADVTSLIRGEAGISPLVTYLYDAPLDARGKIPKLKKASFLVFARPGTRPGEIQLIAPDAQIPATPVDIDRVKSALSALVAPDAPPRILGLGDAFHVAGTIAGEGETQIFLRTENGDPVSLSVLRRPGQPPRWAVALGEIVDEAARAPEPGTLLWYRLACSLPPVLPARAVRTLAVADAEAARADYRLVIEALGPCGRTRIAQ